MARVTTRPLPNPIPAPAPSGGTGGVGDPPPIPMLTGESKTQGRPGDGFVLGGTGLTNTIAVVFADAANHRYDAPSFFVDNDGQLEVVVPDAPPGLYLVGAVVAPASGTNGLPFTILQAPPTITSFTPASGAVRSSVTIMGRHLGTVNEVDFNGASAKFTIVGGQQIVATVPKAATTGPIKVTAPTGTAMTAQPFVVVTAPPTVGSISPASAAPKATITITGTQLLAATVTIGGQVAANVQPPKEKLLMVKVPKLPPGPTTLVVTNALGAVTRDFTVLPG